MILFLYFQQSRCIFNVMQRNTKIYIFVFQAPAAKLIYLFAIQRKKDVQMVDNASKHLGMTSFAFVHQVSFIFFMLFKLH